MDTSRRGFLASTVADGGAAVTPSLAHAADEHAHDHQALPSDPALRVKSLESLLVEKGLVDPAALDAVVDTYEHKVGPRNGARVIARARADPAYKQRLLTDADAAIAELGYSGSQGVQSAPFGRWPRRTQGARLWRRAGRGHAGGRKYTARAQPRRLHAVLLLSVASPWSASGLVQVRALSLTCGHRSARSAA